MKKFLILCVCVAVLYLGGSYVYYQTDFPFSLRDTSTMEVDFKTEGKDICVRKGGNWEKLNICGMNMGSGVPGYFATEFAIDYDTYLEWFAMMQEMNVNVLRVYTIQNDTFYQAFYDYNRGREEPLYLVHGVWLNDYDQRSHLSAFDKEVKEVFIGDCKKVVDIVHGNRRIPVNTQYGSGKYQWDISSYVLGYIVGVEWEPDLVIYTNEACDDHRSYRGEYFSAKPGASPFECFLAEVGDSMMAYETGKYAHQRLLAFANWPETDPLEHQAWARELMNNHAKVDVEHIRTEAAVKSGTFVSYHVYSYYPPFIHYEEQFQVNGKENAYRTYLEMLNEHHAHKPVVISEFGLPTARGIAQKDDGRGLDQGHMNEDQQGLGLQIIYDDIMEAGCAGGMIFSWQDEWFKRTWNTWPYVDSGRTPYWSDVQTNEQMFGVITFEPGKKKSVCYVDGDPSEWKSVKPLTEEDDLSLSMLYDERYLYFRIHKKNLNPETDVFYLPLDITPNSGALEDETNGLSYEAPVDFVAVIQGRKDGRLLVQEYYDPVSAIYGEAIYKKNPYVNPPKPDSGTFNLAKLYLRSPIQISETETWPAQTFSTGELVHGNGNPKSSDFNSLADYCIGKEDIELRIPWGLLNFSDPSSMSIHDDYYKCYGVENLSIDQLQAALYCRIDRQTIRTTGFAAAALKGWDEEVTYHQRIKRSYYYMQETYGKYLER